MSSTWAVSAGVESPPHHSETQSHEDPIDGTKPRSCEPGVLLVKGRGVVERNTLSAPRRFPKGGAERWVESG